MSYISFIKQKFYSDLKILFSTLEITTIWNQWVVKEILKISLIEYLSKGNFKLEKRYVSKINALVLHLLKGQPVQYFFGYTYFKDLKIHVNQHVLIPRPETEELIDLILSYKDDSKIKRIVDVGIGSGCISVALKKEINAIVLGLDYCREALSVAIKNAKNHNIDIECMLINILNKKEYCDVPKVDIIVSNPPYVLDSEVSQDSNILHEPYGAIFVDKKDPLIFYKSICEFANQKLNVGGKIFFEINPNFAIELQNLIYSFGYSNVEIHNDFYDKKRFIVVSS